uniref:Lac2 n=1 Tax=Arundo donax TaxID=35708 RepID=A0A0A9GCH0_ARUDO
MLLWTFTSSRSPSRTRIRGPGDRPFTVGMLFVTHSRVTVAIVTLNV